MRVALIHYWLTNMRGGERVLEAFCDLFPEATIFTHVVDRSKLSAKLNRHEIKTTFISKFPFATSQYQKLLPFMPRALEELDLSDFDLVISSESGPAKGVITRPDAFHLCYCHSPMRYIWDLYPYYLDSAGFLARQVFPGIAHRLRTWDVASAARVDHFVANSNFVKQRIKKFYRRDSDVIHPPVPISEFETARSESPQDYYLAAGELVGYKRFDLVVDAFTQLGLPLKVIGEGEQSKELKRRAGPSIEFLGRVDFDSLKHHFGSCKALVFPGEEDFGMVPVEVMAAGRPIIAYGKGGALDTVIDPRTGVLFSEQTTASIIDAVHRFESLSFDPDSIQEHAAGYSSEVFKSKISELLSHYGISV